MNRKLKTRRFSVVLCITVFVAMFLIGKSKYYRENEIIVEKIVFDDETKEGSVARKYETLNSPSETSNLVNIREIDSSILVDLKYATTDNFTGLVLYDGYDDACLQPDVAQMLAEASRYLNTMHPELRLLVYDAVRPLTVQQKMWECVKDTKYHRYVAHPDRLSLHNFGAAVDLTLTDSLGQPLDMGTPFDHFGRAAGISDEQKLIQEGILTRQQVQNRQLLRQVMRYAGFRSISGEWWHFNACSLQEAKQRYVLVE